MSCIVIGGALANKPFNGGEAWVRLSWLLGLQRLGCTVYLVEQISPAACRDDLGAEVEPGSSINLRYFQRVCAQFGLSERAALICPELDWFHGSSRDDLLALAGSADLLVNISGNVSWLPLLTRFRRRVYLDIDPGYTQFWHEAGNPGARLAYHDRFYTIAENIGRPDCSIPCAGLEWMTVRQPVVLAYWPVVASTDADSFTTVASWRGGFGPIDHAGQVFGKKVHEFRKVLPLPRLTAARFELALDIHPAEARDISALREQGWTLVDPRAVAGDPLSFRDYVQRSGAEFSVAQGVYVDTNSGWFSDRTVRYLASGKPSLVQQTGFSQHLPTGQGLLSFRDLGEAVAGVARIQADHAAHSQAARDLAERYFDSDRVLPRFLEQVGLG